MARGPNSAQQGRDKEKVRTPTALRTCTRQSLPLRLTDRGREVGKGTGDRHPSHWENQDATSAVPTTLRRKTCKILGTQPIRHPSAWSNGISNIHSPQSVGGWWWWWCQTPSSREIPRPGGLFLLDLIIMVELQSPPPSPPFLVQHTIYRLMDRLCGLVRMICAAISEHHDTIWNHTPLNFKFSPRKFAPLL